MPELVNQAADSLLLGLQPLVVAIPGLVGVSGRGRGMEGAEGPKEETNYSLYFHPHLGLNETKHSLYFGYECTYM